ncbi:MAG: heme exporter protein D [Cognaticolwellia sp.]|jgi:heme exporter protein D
MQFDSFSAFIAMGGYGFYVWLSYGVSLLALALLVLSSITNHKKIKQQIAQREKREKKLRQAAELQNAQTRADISHKT